MNLIEKDGYLVADKYKPIDYTNGYHKHLTDKYETDKSLKMKSVDIDI